MVFPRRAVLSSAHRQPVQFNGSGGIWRKAALLQAGGWVGGDSDTEASVTEDLDLSFRVRLFGYESLLLPQVAVPTELPESMAAFRSQQKRWVRGGAQVLRSLLHKLWSPGRSAWRAADDAVPSVAACAAAVSGAGAFVLPLPPLGVLHGLFAATGACSQRC